MEDDDMPIDAYGNRAEVITDPSSTISRMNLGRVYESYLGATSRDNRNRLINYLLTRYGKKKLHQLIPILTEEDIIYCYNYLHGLYKLINPQMDAFITGLTREDLLQHIQEVLLGNIVFFYPPDNEYNIVDVIASIEDSIYRPYYTEVTYRNTLKNKVMTKEKIRIGNMYIMALEKVADDYMAVSSAKVNNFSFPVKSSNVDKHRYQHSHNPTKTLGETEIRIMNAYASPEANAEIVDINTNPNSHKQIIKNILNSDHPIANLPDIDRTANPYGQNKPLMIFKHMGNAFGIDFSYTPEEETFED